MNSSFLRLPTRAHRLAAASALVLLTCTIAACGGGSGGGGISLPVLPGTQPTGGNTTTPPADPAPQMRCAP